MQTNSKFLAVFAHILLENLLRLEEPSDEERGEHDSNDDVESGGGLSGLFEVLDLLDLGECLLILIIGLEQGNLLRLVNFVVVAFVMIVVLSGVERVVRLVRR